ncbi:MAG: UDP-N-acetylmuramoyl-L-alanine--D-glutamate ligase [Candidatus Saccharibacteria bacterium]
MKIAILGYGLQGQSVYEYYKGQDNQITVCDRGMVEDLPPDVDNQFGDSYLARLDRFDLIFRSPSVHPKEIVDAGNGEQILSKVTTNTNEFFKLCPTKNIIGITGTKGKGTTSTLITKMLEGSGRRVHLGGNIGIPPLDLLREDIKEEDWVVLELANFQLIDLKQSPKIAVCLIIEPEHLDWHHDVDEYYQAKTELFRNQTKEDIGIYYAKSENSKRIASTSPGKLIPYYEVPGALVAGSHITIDGIPIIRLGELKLLGKHNWQNVCAAVTTVWQISKDSEPIAGVLREFSGLPFRIELIREVNGIKYYDDSFASAPTATIAAVEAIREPKILIIGGKDRGLDLKSLAEALNDQADSIKKVFLIGEAANRLVYDLDKYGFTNVQVIKSPTTMKDIVEEANKLAEDGDSVVLSPGFPSFDMFKNFEDRGQQFNEVVNGL